MKNTQVSLEPAALSIADTGRYLAVSIDTVRRLIRSGNLPHARIGNSIRIRRADLDAYLCGQTSRQWRPVDGRGRKMAVSAQAGD